MPHLDYLTYLSQIFWFLLFFWLAYSLFFFVFFPNLYYSFSIRNLNFDFLFDNYISSEYNVNFYNFFFKEYSENSMNIFFSYLSSLNANYNIGLTTLYRNIRVFTLFLNLFLNNILYFYWSKGMALNFSSFLGSLLFSDWKSLSALSSINNFHLLDL